MPTPAKYTDNPNEVVASVATPTLREVADAILANWSDLNEQGARTITAQFIGENGWGMRCVNWNIGNNKSPSTNALHVYRSNVWECETQSDADSSVKNGNGLAHIATPDEVAKNKWQCGASKIVVVYQPPHKETRFRAFKSLIEGAAGLLDKYKQIAKSDPKYLASVNAADIPYVVHKLKVIGYFTADEKQYAATMISVKKKIDKQLG